MTAPVPWWKGAVVYQIYPRSFFDADDDGTGDLPGVIAKLDYVKRLGVDAIWLSPFFRSPMADFGYDVSDHLDVDPAFGTMSDFEDLVRRAHDSCEVISDQGYSHHSERHAWFASRRNRDNDRLDCTMADARDGPPPNTGVAVRPAVVGQRRGQYYLHQFPRTAGPNSTRRSQRAVLDLARSGWTSGSTRWLTRELYFCGTLRATPPSGDRRRNAPPVPAPDGTPARRDLAFAETLRPSRTVIDDGCWSRDSSQSTAGASRTRKETTRCTRVHFLLLENGPRSRRSSATRGA